MKRGHVGSNDLGDVDGDDSGVARKRLTTAPVASAADNRRKVAYEQFVAACAALDYDTAGAVAADGSSACTDVWVNVQTCAEACYDIAAEDKDNQAAWWSMLVTHLFTPRRVNALVLALQSERLRGAARAALKTVLSPLNVASFLDGKTCLKPLAQVMFTDAVWGAGCNDDLDLRSVVLYYCPENQEAAVSAGALSYLQQRIAALQREQPSVNPEDDLMAVRDLLEYETTLFALVDEEAPADSATAAAGPVRAPALLPTLVLQLERQPVTAQEWIAPVVRVCMKHGCDAVVKRWLDAGLLAVLVRHDAALTWEWADMLRAVARRCCSAALAAGVHTRLALAAGDSYLYDTAVHGLTDMVTGLRWLREGRSDVLALTAGAHGAAQAYIAQLEQLLCQHAAASTTPAPASGARTVSGTTVGELSVGEGEGDGDGDGEAAS